MMFMAVGPFWRTAQTPERLPSLASIFVQGTDRKGQVKEAACSKAKSEASVAL